MRTEFEVFKGGYDSLGEYIKEYQRKHNAGIKNVVVLRSNEDETIFGVIFERSDFKYSGIRSAKWVHGSPVSTDGGC